jgi:hypothetical protein
MEQRQPKFTLETIPAKTLLHYVKKDELVRSLPPGALVELQRQATQQGQKLTAKFLKDAVMQTPEILKQMRGSQLGFQAYQKYLANYQRITAPEVRAKSRQVRQEMVAPRRGFIGCIASKTDPKVFKECADTYDKPEYQTISLVPSAALKKSAFNKTGSHVLASPSTHISDLPRGLKTYIRNNPLQYIDYLDEIRAQHEYLKSLGRGVHEEQRQGQGSSKKRFVGEGECSEYDYNSCCD